MVSPSAVLGGAETVYENLARLLPAYGVAPHLLVLHDGPLVTRLRSLGLAVDVAEAGRLRSPRAVLATVRAIARRARGVDVVLSNLPKAHLYAGWAARRAGVPAVWWQAGVPDPPHWIDRVASLLPAAAVLAPSAAAAAAQRKLAGSPPVHVAYPGTDVARFSPAAAPALDRRPGEVLVGIVGRLERVKRHDLFRRAARLVLDASPHCRFVVVGDALLGWEGSYPDEIRALPAELGIADRVVFTGHVADVPGVYTSLDVVVSSSLPESFGMVVTEAMACGRPVVAFNVGGPAEIVVDGATGLLAAPGSVAGLAGAMLALVRDPALRARLGAAGRARVENVFSDQASAAGVAEILRRHAHPKR